ncbi:MAG: phage terminase large subunit [Sulfuricaulis sp.]|nr:phage terminase large subunit [Sulfuricaulis sp.]
MMQPRQIEVSLPPLHRGQLEITRDPARFRVVSAGRRFGKTRLAAALSIAAILQQQAVMWVAPAYPIADIGWRMLSHLAKQMPGIEIRQGDRRITSGRGWVQVRSADSEGGLRGEGLDLLIMDEAAHIRNFTNIWEQELRATLTDRQGRALFISTPKGFNHFFDLFRQAETDPEWAAYRHPSSDNPYLAAAEIAAARGQLPALVFRQEFEAEFVQLAGALFKREWFDVVEQAPPLVSQARHWDLAASTKTQADYSVGARVGMDANGNAYILDCQRGRWEWPTLVRIISQTALGDGPDIVQAVEITGTQRGMLDLLLAEPALAATPFRGVSPVVDKITRVNTWLARAEQSKVKLLRGSWNAAWLDEICAFPEAEYDDQVDATSGAFLCLAYSGPLFYE